MIPQVDFLGAKIGRLVVGDNPVNGHSYIPDLIPGEEMLDYFTEARVMEAMEESARLGYTCWMPLANDFMLRAIRHYRLSGGKLQIIFQSYPLADFAGNLRQMAACAPVGIYHQGTTTDGLVEAGKTDVLRDRIKMIHDLGVKAAIGTHVPETILRAEDEDWGCDFYVACLHNTRKRGAAQESSFITGKPKHLKFFMEDRPLMLDAIRRVSKPCVAFKLYAGGQIFYGKDEAERDEAAKAALSETFSAIKPGDVAALGFFQRDGDQLQKNARLFAEAVTQ